MVIDIKTFLSGTPETLAAQVQTLPYPVVLMDEDLKIVAKNIFASQYIKGLQTRVLIKRFVSPEDYLKLVEMTEGQTVYVELIGDERRYGATVVAGNAVRVAVIHPLGAGMQSHIERLYGKMSGYDLGIVSPSEAQMRDLSIKSNTAQLFIEKIEGMYRLHSLSFFNPASVLRSLCSELVRFIPDEAERIKCDNVLAEIIVCGSEQDFALLLGVLISFCLDHSDGTIDMSMTEDFDDAVFRLRVDADKDFYSTVKNALDGLSSEEISDDLTSFNIYLLKLVADGNLWELCIEPDSSGALCFSLRAKLTEPFGAIELRDLSEEYLLNIIKILFS